MNPMQRVVLVFLAVLVLKVFSASAETVSDLNSADELFSQKRYAEALAIYETLPQAPNSNAQNSNAEYVWKARYRAVEAEALLFRYAEALKRAYSFELPTETLWKSRFLILRSETLREFIAQYAHAAPEQSVANSDPADFSIKTEEELHRLVDDNYRQLYFLREFLAQNKIGNESYFISVDKSDLKNSPTVWDFVVQRWTDFLFSSRPETFEVEKPRPELFAKSVFGAKLDLSSARATIAGSLFEISSKLQNPKGQKGDLRKSVRNWAKLQRHLIPWLHPSVVGKVTDKSKLAAARALRELGKSFSDASLRDETYLQAALLFESGFSPGEAIRACRLVGPTIAKPKKKPFKSKTIVAAQSPSLPALRCRALAEKLEAPRIEAETDLNVGNGSGLRLRAKNTDAVYLRVMPTTVSELKSMRAQVQPGVAETADFTFLRDPDARTLTTFGTRKPILERKIPTKPKSAYTFAENNVAFPLTSGFYVVVASNRADFDSQTGVVSAALLNVTDLVLFGDASRLAQGGQVEFNLFAVDAKTGVPVRGAQIEAINRVDYKPSEPKNGSTDERGHFSFSGNSAKQHQLDALAISGLNHAIWQTPLFFSPDSGQKMRLFLDTDRPIYKPGENVEVKLTALAKMGEGFRPAERGQKAHVTARDAAGEIFFERDFASSDFGATTFRLELPKDRLLGNYSIEASAEFGSAETTSVATEIRVEQYRKPEFEVTLNDLPAGLTYNAKATVTGRAAYFQGAAVAGAKVRYRITREAYVPPFCWWWASRKFLNATVEFQSGETQTDAQGNFSISLTPKPSANERDLPSRFVIATQTTDGTGRTIAADRRFSAGAQSFLFEADLATTFLDADEKNEIALRARTFDGTEVATHGRFFIHELLATGSVGPLRASGNFTLEPEGKTALKIPKIAQGSYSLRIDGTDADGRHNVQSFSLVVAGKDPATLALPAVTLVEHSRYEVGETAQLLVGSQHLKGPGLIEVWQADRLLRVDALRPGVQRYKLPLEPSYEGGVFVRWFGIYEHRLRGGEVRVSVPWKTPRLELAVSANSKYRPGEKVRWKVSARDAKGNAVEAESLVRVYDRSLDAYASLWDWTDSLYVPTTDPQNAPVPVFVRNAVVLAAGPALYFAPQPKPTSLPSLRLNQSRWYPDSRGLGPTAMVRYSQTPLGANAAEPAAPVSPIALPEKLPRTKFSETALFAPRVAIKNGEGLVEFAFPESLTSWSVFGAAVTADGKIGHFRSQTITRKELMIQVVAPRFLREGDESALKLAVTNESDRSISARVKLNLSTKDPKRIFPVAVLPSEKILVLEPHTQKIASWKITTPATDSTLVVRGSVEETPPESEAKRSGLKLSDSEQREVAILPASARTVAAKSVVLEGEKTERIELPPLSKEARVETAVLEIAPQLPVILASALPALAVTNDATVEAILSRYVPLSAIKQVFDRFPTLKSQLGIFAKGKGQKSDWEQEDPRRQTALSESPWLGLTREDAGPSAVSLLDPERVAEQSAKALAQLEAAQLPDGGFAWLAGGRADLYITLYVLEQLAEGAHFGVPVPEKLTQRALGFIAKSVAADRNSVAELSLGAYAAFAVTQLAPTDPDFRALAKTWLEKSETRSENLSALGNAYASQAYRNLGNTESASKHLARATDAMREDPVTGSYWTPEKQSWLWYADSFEKHAFLLKTLARANPKDPKIPGLVRWLLFQRKANGWGSPKASVSALTALLEVLSGTNGDTLEREERFTWNWNAEKFSFTAEPKNSLELKSRWIRSDQELGEKFGTATIEKHGPGVAFASLTTVYSTTKPPAVSNLVSVARRIFRLSREGGKSKLVPVKEGEPVKAGDELEVQTRVSARAPLSYVLVQSPLAAGTEPRQTLSGWSRKPIVSYEEIRDASVRYYLPTLGQGETVLSTALRVVTPGQFRVAPATVQSLHSPEVAASTVTADLNVE